MYPLDTQRADPSANAGTNNSAGTSGSSTQQENRGNQPAKKRKAGGRLANTADFWGMVEAFFIKRTQEWGASYKAPQWKQ